MSPDPTNPDPTHPDPQHEPSRLPDLDPGAAGLHAAWYAANVVAGRVTAQRCGCGRWRHPARYRCATCRSEVWSFEPVSGVGVVESVTVTRRAFHGAYADAVPYPIAVVAVPEGVRWFVRVEIDDPERLRIGDAVDVMADGHGVPAARPSRIAT